MVTSMRPAQAFDDADRFVAESALKRHYGRIVRVELAEAEIRPEQELPDVVCVPICYWSEQGVEYVVFKLAEDRLRSWFVYPSGEQIIVEREFDDIDDCVTVTLRVQAAHAAGDGDGSPDALPPGRATH